MVNIMITHINMYLLIETRQNILILFHENYTEVKIFNYIRCPKDALLAKVLGFED